MQYRRSRPERPAPTPDFADLLRRLTGGGLVYEVLGEAEWVQHLERTGDVAYLEIPLRHFTERMP